MKTMKQLTSLAYGLSLAMFAGGATAHGLDAVGQPACLEANFMMADAMNAPFAAADGPGQVLEVSIVTGARGITVANPFGGMADPNGPVCENGSGNLECPGPFKPTGVLSGGLNGHAFITSAAQQALTQFHRDGTPIRTVSFRPLLGNPTGPAGRGTLPRPLGTQMMPNGNLVQAICDANFFNASNSDPIQPGEPDPKGDGNSSNLYFPPVYQTAEHSANSRVLVIDQETMQVIDEYSQPADQDPRWTCMAGIAFSEEGMGLSMFHGAAIAMVDWKDGVEDTSCGVGCNKGSDKDGHEMDDDDNDDIFKLGKHKNRAKVTRWIDLRPGMPADHPSRRDSLRAWGYDEDGTIYVTDRERSRDCVRGEYAGIPGGCNPGVFRQKVQVVDYGDDFPSRTIGLDPGVNVIAGIRPNRMSAVACDAIGGPGPDGKACDVETLLIAASAFNPGCTVTGSVPPARCFVQGGGVGEYSILPEDADATDGTCTGVQTGADSSYGPGGENSGCAQPIATYLGRDNVTGSEDMVDPRMLMVIHEAFVQ
ncbi:MAG: hypothetical protein BMS9Abin08_0524 [Gammaproteobacteria bacterium]|nr:MAG: hypothetical protein BMS9Abin08_0524 [Gammaproteobacteria bacterium]